MSTSARERNHSAAGLREWRRLCEWLERQPRKASYRLRSGASIPSIAAKDRPAGLIFYSSGWGWRLRKDWRARLESLERGAASVALAGQRAGLDLHGD